MVTLLILVTGYWLALPRFIPPINLAKVKAARANIGEFAGALDMFKKENGYYPAGRNGLNDLVIKPANATTNWRPYRAQIPLDPWGHPYLYVSPGKHNTNSYDLSSAGPDGIPGTPDDITNWQLPNSATQ